MDPIIFLHHYIVHTKAIFLPHAIEQQVNHLLKNIFLVLLTFYLIEELSIIYGPKNLLEINKCKKIM